jgi:hypothetical protein
VLYEGDALNEPTAPLHVIETPPSTVAPPSADNLTVWTPPERVAPVPSALDEDTAAQPIVQPADAATVQLPIVPDDPAAGHGPAEGKRRGLGPYGRGVGIFAVVAAILAAAVAVAALVVVLAKRGDDSPSNVPTLGGPAPSGVRLTDSGTEIGISWQDPTEGTVSFMVTMGRQGEILKPVATLGPGKTSYALGGLNGALNYCFTVVAVYRDSQFATSPQACTSRTPATPR